MWRPMRRYNTTLKSEFGASAYTAVTDTGTYGMSEYAPFELTMQSVRCFVTLHHMPI